MATLTKRENPLTLEKLGIMKELQELKVEVVRMIEKFDAHLEADRANVECLREIIKNHDRILNGNNGHIGLSTHVDRLNEKEKARAWNLRVVWTAIISLMAKVIYDLFKGGV